MARTDPKQAAASQPRELGALVLKERMISEIVQRLGRSVRLVEFSERGRLRPRHRSGRKKINLANFGAANDLFWISKIVKLIEQLA